MILYLTENGEIDITPEGKELASFKNLWKDDKTEKKSYFKKVLKFLYHAYKREHALHNLSFEQREKKILSDYFDGENIRYLKNNKNFDDCVEQYKECEYTMNGLVYESLKSDIYNMKDHLRNIPFYKKQKVQQTVKVKVNDIEEDIYIDTVVDIDNSEEKLKCLANINKLLELEEKLRAICTKEIGVKKEFAKSMRDSGKLVTKGGTK